MISGFVRPQAIEAMKEISIDISGHRSKSVDEFAGQAFDYVITVCDKLASRKGRGAKGGFEPDRRRKLVVLNKDFIKCSLCPSDAEFFYPGASGKYSDL